MKNTAKFLAVLAVGVAALSAQAGPISGYIAFHGTGSFDGSDLATATKITAFAGVTVSALTQTGDYVGLDGLAVAMTPFTFNPSGAPVTPWWTLTVGPTTYSFDIATITIPQQTSTFLSLTGSGTAHITGLDDTDGIWSLTTQHVGQTTTLTLSFSADTTVPDGGMTLALLGLGLVAVEGFRRKLAK